MTEAGREEVCPARAEGIETSAWLADAWESGYSIVVNSLQLRHDACAAAAKQLARRTTISKYCKNGSHEALLLFLAL